MRSISVAHRLELEFPGSINKHAIAFGDINGDGDSELAAGNIHGTLCLYKGLKVKPWRSCSGLGVIACVTFGSVCNDGAIYLCCANSRGTLYLFGQAEQQIARLPCDSKEEDNKVTADNPPEIPYLLEQEMPPNPKIMVVEDVDGDGQNELVIGYTDRVVRIFKWKPVPSPDESSSTETEMRPKSHSFAKRAGLVKQGSKESQKDVSARESTSDSGSEVSSVLKGSFVMEQQFALTWHIGSIAVCRNQDDETLLMASHVGGGYTVLASYSPLSKDKDSSSAQAECVVDEKSELTCAEREDSFPTLFSVMDNRKRSRIVVESEICGSRYSDGRASGVAALCCLDGLFMVVDFKSDAVTSINTDHHLFKLDRFVTDGDMDRIAACSWDGMVYITEKDNTDLISLNFGESVSTFAAGQYSIAPGRNVTAFVFATFPGRLVVCYDIKLEIEVWNLQEALMKHLSEKPDVESLLSEYSDGMPTHPAYFKTFIQQLWSMKAVT